MFHKDSKLYTITRSQEFGHQKCFILYISPISYICTTIECLNEFAGRIDLRDVIVGKLSFFLERFE